MSWITFHRRTRPIRDTLSAHLPHPSRAGYCLCNLTIGDELKEATGGQRKCERCVRRSREMRRGRWGIGAEGVMQ